MNEITLEIHQLPPAACSPNARCHWTVKKRAADLFGNEIWVIARQHRCPPKPFEKATISLTLVVKQNRRRDLDNFWVRFKPGCDALVRAGILVDDDMEHLQHGRIEVVVDKERAPMTVIRILKEGS